jgi:hypothetical protein
MRPGDHGSAKKEVAMKKQEPRKPTKKPTSNPANPSKKAKKVEIELTDEDLAKVAGGRRSIATQR